MGVVLAQPSGATLDVVLRPVRDGTPEVTSVEVTADLRGLAPARERFSIQAPIVYASVTGIADRIEALELGDAAGAVPLTVEDDPADPGGFPSYRHWRAGRAVSSPAVLRYRVRPQATPPTPGPVFSMRAHHGGFSGAGAGFLAVPEDIGALTMRVGWDLSALAPGATAGSTFGDGDFVLVGEPRDLLQGYYMAGPLGRYAPPEAKGAFVAYWLGRPAFDPEEEMAWAYRVYAYQQAFFREPAPVSYRVFVRAVPGATRRLGGTALRNSFMLAVPVGAGARAAESPRETIAHETGHMFIGTIPPEAGGGPWFNEGLNVHYTRLVMLRSGLAPADDYARSVAETARRYYANAFRNESAASLDRIGFSAGVGDGGAQNVPYTRGSLYFAMVDFKIRQASSGARSLDDVVLALLERRRRGDELTREAIVDALAGEYGPSARTDFERVILNGETVVPPAGAFGPCLDRRPARVALEGREADGYEWFRVEGVPDERCRRW